MQEPRRFITMRKVLAAGLVLGLLATPVSSQSPSDELAKGIRQAQQGEFETAAVTLDQATRSLAAAKAPVRDVARAYLYLGVAQLGLSQDAKAKASFVQARRLDPSLKLDAAEFPPKVIQAYDQALKEAGQPVASSTAPKTASTAKPPKGKSKTVPILLGVGAAAGIAVAVAAGGGGGGPTSSTVGVRRDAVFTARPQCAQVVGGACTSAANSHEVMVSAGGVLEATLIADNPGARLFLRAVSPSNRMIEAGPSGTTLRIPAEPGRWVLSVWQQGKAPAEARYQLRVSFP